MSSTTAFAQTEDGYLQMNPAGNNVERILKWKIKMNQLRTIEIITTLIGIISCGIVWIVANGYASNERIDMYYGTPLRQSEHDESRSELFWSVAFRGFIVTGLLFFTGTGMSTYSIFRLRKMRVSNRQCT